MGARRSFYRDITRAEFAAVRSRHGSELYSPTNNYRVQSCQAKKRAVCGKLLDDQPAGNALLLHGLQWEGHEIYSIAHARFDWQFSRSGGRSRWASWSLKIVERQLTERFMSFPRAALKDFLFK